MRMPVAVASALTAALGVAHAQEDRVQTVTSQTGNVRIETIARGLEHPWGLAFLPDGRMLVTERPGRLRVVAKDGQISEPLSGVPRVFARGQGGPARRGARPGLRFEPLRLSHLR